MTDELEFTEQEQKDYIRIINEIRNKLISDGFTIEQEWFPDGYLVANDHKMWHLELKECPNWKFGVWLDELSDFEEKLWAKKFYRLHIFAQHKDYINKFKPTDCKVVEEYHISKEDLQEYKVLSDFDLKRWTEIFRYVKEQPYLAWYRNETYTDYNLEYVSPAKAKKEFLKSEKEQSRYENVQNKIEKAELAWMKKYLDNLGYKYKITTDKYCSPEHNVIIEDPTIEEKGCYSLMDDDKWAEFSSISRGIKEKSKLEYGVYSTFDNSAIFTPKMDVGDIRVTKIGGK